MTPEQLIQVKEKLFLTCLAMGKELPQPVVTMFGEDLKDLPFDATMMAIDSYRRDGKNRQAPMPGQIRDMVLPKVEDKDQARDCAALILKAISRRGYYWAGGSMMDGVCRFEGNSGVFHETFETACKEFCGDLAWEVIQRFGGWQRLCEVANDSQDTTLMAQLRDLADSLQKKARAGSLDQPPGLPASQNSVPQLDQGRTQAFISSTLKGMP